MPASSCVISTQRLEIDSLLVGVAVAAAVHVAGVAAGEEASELARLLACRSGSGRTRWCTRCLPPPSGRCLDVLMWQLPSGDGIPTLLIGTDPQPVGTFGKLGCSHLRVLYERTQCVASRLGRDYRALLCSGNRITITVRPMPRRHTQPNQIHHPSLTRIDTVLPLSVVPQRYETIPGATPVTALPAPPKRTLTASGSWW